MALEIELQEANLRIKELENELETSKSTFTKLIEEKDVKLKEYREANQKYYERIIQQEKVVKDTPVTTKEEGNEAPSFEDFTKSIDVK